MKCRTRTMGRIAGLLTVWLAWAPTVFGDNIVVDGLNGDDANGGVSLTGGPGNLADLDFSDAFKTIGKATDVSVAGDFIFVNAGRYSEQVEPKASTTLIAVGEAIVENVPIGFRIAAVSITVDGFTILNCNNGVSTNAAAQARMENLTIRNCGTGLGSASVGGVARRCVITDCNFGIVGGSNVFTGERCTLVSNLIGASLSGGTIVFRNNIVAFNGSGGITGTNQFALVDFNDVFGNGTDYSGAISPGPHDVSVDPQFVDLSRRILLLEPTSPLINAGEELGGGPAVTIGAREIGFASSDALDGWTDWIDENGVLLTSGLSTLVEIDPGTGHIVLKAGVDFAAVRSPVFDEGPLKSVSFAALEDLAAVSGSRWVVDQNDATFQRELRFRASASSFGPSDVMPAFELLFEGQVLNLPQNLRFVQVELTLTRNGK